ncbi:MAG: hypothetical protein HKN78_04235 [Sphingomonadaceae bacterium]|nr:hypothetical protein [Sphingomonadaceae bacterium]
MVAPPGPGADDSKRGFDAAYEELIESERIQTEFAQPEQPEAIELNEPPQWLIDLLAFFGQTGSVWQGFFWIVAGLFAALLLFFFGRFLLRLYADRSSRDGDAAEEDWRPEESAARSLLAEADSLAKDARYAEAAHLLLFRSLEDIENRLPDFLRPALTSRDIARSDTLPDQARRAFAAIAQVVERGVFAARPVDASGWDEARGAYERFALGGSWR